jgi:hypothetical protein
LLDNRIGKYPAIELLVRTTELIPPMPISLLRLVVAPFPNRMHELLAPASVSWPIATLLFPVNALIFAEPMMLFPRALFPMAMLLSPI